MKSARPQRNAAAPTIEILHLDNHLLVVCKPCGLLVQEDATGDTDLLSWGKDYLKRRFNKPGNVFLGLVHRLDRPVSGTMVLARTSKAAARLSEQFRGRTVLKKYCALVEGRMIGEGSLTHHIRKSKGKASITRAVDERGRRADLQWRSVAEIGGRTLVDVTLDTGRPHQIRLQLAAAGHPVVGDVKHGASKALPDRSLALHCYALCLEHPVQRERMCWSCEPRWEKAWLDHIQPLIQAVVTTSTDVAASAGAGSTTT